MMVEADGRTGPGGGLPRTSGLAPAKEMDREIKESIISSLKLVLRNRKGKILYNDTGRYAGLEIVGDMVQYY